MSSYEDYLPRLLPPWLRRAGGFAYHQGVGRRMEGVVDRFRDAVNVRFPELAPSDGLPEIGRERQMPQTPGETTAAYGTRLRNAWTAWGGDNTPITGEGGGAGSALGLLNAIEALGLPTGPTGATIIRHTGRAATVDPVRPALGYAQLDVSGNLVLGAGPVNVNRQDLFGNVPGDLVGFTLDWRDQFYSKFAVTFLADVPTLRAGTDIAAQLNAAMKKWKQSKDHHVGTFVIEAGGGWDWPPTQLWNDGTLWDSDTVHFIPPA